MAHVRFDKREHYLALTSANIISPSGVESWCGKIIFNAYERLRW